MKIIAVDIDGFIAERTPERSEDFLNFVPKRDIIERVNKLFENGYTIIYYTAREQAFYLQTHQWLLKQGCQFNSLKMGKLRADYYLDDKNATLEALEGL